MIPPGDKDRNKNTRTGLLKPLLGALLAIYTLWVFLDWGAGKPVST